MSNSNCSRIYVSRRRRRRWQHLLQVRIKWKSNRSQSERERPKRGPGMLLICTLSCWNHKSKWAELSCKTSAATDAESPHLIISILYLTDRAANRTYHCVCARDGTTRQAGNPGSQAIRINYTNCISMSRVLMDHRPRRRCSMLASRYPMLISIIVKITAQCTSNFVDGKEWLPLPVLQGTPRTRPRRSVSARRLWPAAAPKARDTSGRRRKKTKREKQNWAPLDCPLRWLAARCLLCR